LAGGNTGQIQMTDHFHDLLDLVDFQADVRDQQIARQVLMEAYIEKNTANVPVLVHAQPTSSEGIESYLFRSAGENALKSAAELQRALRLPISKPLSRKRHVQLRDSLGGDLSTIAAMVPTVIHGNLIQYGAHQLSRHHLALTTSRLCPICIAAEEQGKLHWKLAPFAVCEEHGVYLIDSCTCSPGRPLNTSRPSFSVCRCGNDLRNTPTRLAGPSAHSLSITVSRLFNANNDLTKSIADVQQCGVPRETNLCGLLDLIAFLASLDADMQTMNLAFARPLVRMEPVIQQFNKAADALFDWPNGIFALFRTVGRQQARGKGSQRIYEGLRHTTIAAERHLPRYLNRWFLDAIALYMDTPGAWAINPMQR